MGLFIFFEDIGMYQVIKFTVFGSTAIISTYNLMIAIGIITGIILFEYKCDKNGISKKEIDNLMVVICVSIVFGFISGAIFDKFVHYNNIKDILSHLLAFTGITFAGGLLGGALVFLICYKMIMGNFRNVMIHINHIAPSLAIAHFLGRIGCFFGGCCFGKPTNSIIGVRFPVGSLTDQLYGRVVKVIPTQLIEALFLMIIFFITYFWLRKNAFSYYLILYGIFRFMIEFFRGDDRGALFQTMLTPSQWISILMILIGGFLLYMSHRKQETHRGFSPRA